MTDTMNTHTQNNHISISQVIVMGENGTRDTLRNPKRQGNHHNHYATRVFDILSRFQCIEFGKNRTNIKLNHSYIEHIILFQ